MGKLMRHYGVDSPKHPQRIDMFRPPTVDRQQKNHETRKNVKKRKITGNRLRSDSERESPKRKQN